MKILPMKVLVAIFFVFGCVTVHGPAYAGKTGEHGASKERKGEETTGRDRENNDDDDNGATPERREAESTGEVARLEAIKKAAHEQKTRSDNSLRAADQRLRDASVDARNAENARNGWKEYLDDAVAKKLPQKEIDARRDGLIAADLKLSRAIQNRDAAVTGFDKAKADFKDANRQYNDAMSQSAAAKEAANDLQKQRNLVVRMQTHSQYGAAPKPEQHYGAMPRPDPEPDPRNIYANAADIADMDRRNATSTSTSASATGATSSTSASATSGTSASATGGATSGTSTSATSSSGARGASAAVRPFAPMPGASSSSSSTSSSTSNGKTK